MSMKKGENEMLILKDLTLGDIEEIRPYFLFSTNKMFDNSIGSVIMWREFFSMEYALLSDTFILKMKIAHHGNITAFSMPLGKDISGSFDAINDYCHNHDIPIVYYPVTKEDLPALSAAYRNLKVYEDAGWGDYLYMAQDITTLAGRKYHGQRNHINAFNKTYSTYAFEEITNENITQVSDFYDTIRLTVSKDSDVFKEEQKRTCEVLSNYDTYGLIGGAIRVGDSITAFSIGERINDVLFIHIEKADLTYRGIYPVMTNAFARHYVTQGIKYINRGEDVGDEGLRTAKKSYHPCEIIDKYIVEVIED